MEVLEITFFCDSKTMTGNHAKRELALLAEPSLRHHRLHEGSQSAALGGDGDTTEKKIDYKLDMESLAKASISALLCMAFCRWRSRSTATPLAFR